MLAINQLVLSQEFGSAAEIRERVARVRAFREDVEQTAEQAPSPVHPSDFLRLIVSSIQAEATKLAEAAEGAPSDAGDALRRVVSTIGEEAARAHDRLAGSEPGRISAILAVLDVDDARQLQQARLVLDDHGGELRATSVRSLERIVELLEMFSIARTHFRTNYTQRVLSRLSRLLLYTGLPAIVAAFWLSLLAPPGDPTRGILVASTLLATAFAPVAILSSYVLRIATVSERTLAAGPFESRPG